MRRGMSIVVGILCLEAVSVSFAARPVARWDVVPDQVFAGRFQAGVCAFHMAGVKVEFRLGDRLLHTAERPTLNDQSGVWEFWCPLEAAEHRDGPLELSARAIPLVDGEPHHDLPTLTLYANAKGTLTVARTNWVDAVNGDDANPGTAEAPYRTLAAAVIQTPAGGVINLRAGHYTSNGLNGGHQRPYWTTIQAAPGVARDDVEIGPGRPSTQRLRWRNVTLACDFEGKHFSILNGENGKHLVWLDDCKAYNKKGRWAGGVQTLGNRYIAYITGGITTEMGNGPSAALIRNHTIDTITSDAWTGGWKLVVNSVCRHIHPGKTGAHPDFHQSYAVAPDWIEDVILYNVRGLECVSQGLFGSRLRHAAFVNVLFKKGDTAMLSQYSGPMENVLFLHLTIPNQSWLWREGYTPVDVHMANSLLLNMSGGDRTGLTVAGNHFMDAAKAAGTEVTTGDPRFRAPASHDYRLQPDSPARGMARPLQCVPADIDGVPHPTTGRNRGCFANAPE